VLVNTTNLPRELVEAELFGTRRGAYSGAVDRDGAIVRADRGTVFFDEIGDFELALQPKILRVVETRRVTPLGADSSRAIDVRFVCATHRDLDAMVAAGEFRQDLFVRLSHERVRLPPLRARREEIPWLVALALCEQWKALGCAPLPATPELIEVCCLRTWEGENVRGLLRSVGAAARAAVRAARATGENAVRPEHVPDETPPTAPRTATIRDEKRAAGRATLRRAMAEHDGNVARAAEACGISLATAYRWLKEE
jgi:transcriptional regulator with PAS, ATPase and Fis domain